MPPERGNFSLDGLPTEPYPAELHPAELFDDEYWRRLAEFLLRQAMSPGSAGTVEILTAPGTAADRLQVIQTAGWRQRDEARAYRLNATLRPLAGVSHRRAVLATPLVADLARCR